MFGKPPWLLCVATGEPFPLNVQWTEFYLVARALDQGFLQPEHINAAWGRLSLTCVEGSKFLQFYLRWRLRRELHLDQLLEAGLREAEEDAELLLACSRHEQLQLVVSGGDSFGRVRFGCYRQDGDGNHSIFTSESTRAMPRQP